MPDGPGQVEVQDARLDPCDPCGRVHVEHPVHRGGDDDDRITERCRAAGQPGAAAACDERPSVAAGHAHGCGDILGRFGPAHGDRFTGRDTGIARVQRELEGFGARAPSTDRGAQIVDERVGRRDCRSLPSTHG